MRPVLCNTLDNGGGAAIAARRLHLGLRGLGDDSVLAVMQQSGDTPGVHAVTSRLRRTMQPFIRQAERLPLLCYPGRDRRALFSPSWRPSGVHRRIKALRPDVVHLHWIADSFLPLHSLARLGVPVVWTLHDTWALTGGCHILKGCEGYRHGCGRCPQLGSGAGVDMSSLGYALRKSAYKRLNLTIAAPSRHLEFLAKSSPLLQHFPIIRIPNGVDTDRFRPINQRLARQMLQLPQDVPLVVFGAVSPGSDPNKGFDLLCAALGALPTPLRKQVCCAVFGGSVPAGEMPLSVIELGHLHDDVALALAYSAADVFICPSREENLPNTVMEALSCGTPVAAFRTGGIPDMIADGENGALAPCFDVKALADGIAWLVQCAPEKKDQLRNAARQKALSEYSLHGIAQRYHDLYLALLSGARPSA
ncbi:MAG: glycosyltransferase [Desulfovibrio sp.]|uniref:glycosyltransferase n=1 Tax=Desulfovibrio sp. TaxID=885 RepID=UPI0039E43636